MKKRDKRKGYRACNLSIRKVVAGGLPGVSSQPRLKSKTPRFCARNLNKYKAPSMHNAWVSSPTMHTTVQQHTLIILALGRERQGDQKFNVGLGYTELEASVSYERLGNKTKQNKVRQNKTGQAPYLT